MLLARALAAAGVPVLRFDYRGLGDSLGEPRDFTAIDVDIRAAINVFIARTGVRRVLLWGLCDAASASMMYAHSDPRVCGVVLLNPWVHSVTTEAQVRLKSYYLGRLRSAEFWRKILRLEFDWRGSWQSLSGYVGAAVAASAPASGEHFIDRMRKGWNAFAGPVLLILSGDDLTAGEFRQLVESDQQWRALLQSKQPHTVNMADPNHTFARAAWRTEVENETLRWLGRLTASDETA